MPVPKPKDEESQDDFVGRCHTALADEFTDEKQRHAVCMDAWRKSSANAAYVTFAVQQAGEPRTENLMGREFRVVPAVLVQSQVLNNNLGATFLPVDEITQEWAETANGRPVLSDHPSQRGQPVSANAPEILNDLGIGFLFHGRVEEGKLKADVYLDEARAADMPDLKAILAKLDAGEKIEGSTGFPVRALEKAPGVHNGHAFDFVLRPAPLDHFAAFANKIGACSISDGCGLAQNAKPEPNEAPMTDATPKEGWLARAVTAFGAFLSQHPDVVADHGTPTDPKPVANKAGEPTPEEGSTMNREQMIAHLAQAGTLDSDALGKLTDCQLNALMEAGKPAQQPATPEDKNWQTKALNYRRELEELRAKTEHALNTELQERTDMLDDLLSSGRAVQWSENELKGMDTGELRKVYRQVFDSADYSGRGGPRGFGAPIGNFDFAKNSIVGGANSVIARKETN